MIDRHELLATLKPLVTELEESIRERALATPEVAAHLEQEHHKAVVAERTAMSLEEWRDGEITQAAVAWVLGCVFVRFLEDNGLIDQALISGPGRSPRCRARPSARSTSAPTLSTATASTSRRAFVRSRRSRRSRRSTTSGTTRCGVSARRPTARAALRETFTAIDPDERRARPRLHRPGSRHPLPRRPLPGPLRGRQEALRAAADAGVRRAVHPRPHAHSGDRRVRARRGAAHRPDVRLGPLPHRRIRAALRAVAGARAGTSRDGARAALPSTRSPGSTSTRMRPRSRGSGSSSPRCAPAGSVGSPRRPRFRLHLATGDSLLHGPFRRRRDDAVRRGPPRPEHRACLRDRGRRASSARSLDVATTPLSVTRRTSRSRTRRCATPTGPLRELPRQVRADRAVHGAVLRARAGPRRRMARRARWLRRQDHRQQLHEARVRRSARREVPAIGGPPDGHRRERRLHPRARNADDPALRSQPTACRVDARWSTGSAASRAAGRSGARDGVVLDRELVDQPGSSRTASCGRATFDRRELLDAPDDSRHWPGASTATSKQRRRNASQRSSSDIGVFGCHSAGRHVHVTTATVSATSGMHQRCRGHWLVATQCATGQRRTEDGVLSRTTTTLNQWHRSTTR